MIKINPAKNIFILMAIVVGMFVHFVPAVAIDDVITDGAVPTETVPVASTDSEKKSAEPEKQTGDTAKRVAGGLSTAAMGIGGMQLAQGLAEQKADKQAVKEIDAYLSGFRCGISNGAHDVPGGTTDVQLPVYSNDFMKLRREYVGDDGKSGLVAKTRMFKSSLGLPAGIESETVLDAGALYDNKSIGSGATQFDTASQRLEDDKKRIKVGAIIAGGGALVGIAAPTVIDAVSGAGKSGKESQSSETNTGGGTSGLGAGLGGIATSVLGGGETNTGGGTSGLGSMATGVLGGITEK